MRRGGGRGSGGKSERRRHLPPSAVVVVDDAGRLRISFLWHRSNEPTIHVGRKKLLLLLLLWLILLLGMWRVFGIGGKLGRFRGEGGGGGGVGEQERKWSEMLPFDVLGFDPRLLRLARRRRQNRRWTGKRG